MKIYQYYYNYIFNDATVKTHYGFIFDNLEDCKNELMYIKNNTLHFFKGRPLYGRPSHHHQNFV